MRSLVMGFAMTLAIAVPSFAAAGSDAKSFEEVRSQQSQIREGILARSGRYGKLEPKTAAEIIRRQDKLLAAIEGKQSPDELPAGQRDEVMASIGWIDAAIDRANEERIVCDYVKTTGSNRKQRVCRSVSQIEADREAAAQTIEKLKSGK